MSQFKFLSDKVKVLIINLKVLGNIQKGMKLKSHDKYLEIDPITWYQPIQRFINREDRTYTYNKLSEMNKYLFDFISEEESHKYLNFNNNTELYVFLLPIIERSMIGINNLKETYEEDKTCVSQLEVEIANLEMITKNIKNKLNELGIKVDSKDLKDQKDSKDSKDQKEIKSPPNSPMSNLNLNELSDNWNAD